jgi:hypothetical protein
MARANVDLLAFNRGIISPKALARTDVERTRLSAARMNNWLPKTQGAMTLRPGTKYLGSSKSDQAAAWIEFVASSDSADKALLELTDGLMRVWIEDDLLSRVSVTTSISNGTFSSSTGWTDGSTGGGSCSFGGSGLTLNAANIGGLAKCTRQITVASGDQNKEHALAIVVTRGPVTFRVGSTVGGDEYVSETSLGTGHHSLAFTPTGDFYLTFQSDLDIDRIVASIAVEASGTVEIVGPWATADLAYVRYDQSADVVYVAAGIKQTKIERRGTGRSWSVVDYKPANGPFQIGRSAKVRLKPSATYGNITLTSDAAFFVSGHVGALFRAFHNGQSQVCRMAREDVVTPAIKVTGVGDGADTAERRVKIVTTGTWSATITVQRSYDGEDIGFHDTATTITTNATTNIDDTDDNLDVWYRLKIKTGNFTSGVAIATITYNNGGVTGICRITAVTDNVTASAEVLSRFSLADWTDDWNEGQWSDASNWPSVVQLYEGRLWWAGGSQIFGSVSDDYENFDDETEGDSAPINRSLGKGPVDVVTGLAGARRLISLTPSSVIALQSTSFDEPLTPTNASAKTISTQGAKNVRPVLLDTKVVFAHRSGQRLYILGYDYNVGDYSAADGTKYVPDLLVEGVVSIAIQRFPDTRIHCVLADGTVALLSYDDVEDLLAWHTWSTDGIVEQAVVLPGEDEDRVYYHIRRTVDGNTVRYLERWADESDCVGGALSWLADCAVSFTNSPASATITGLDHLEGKDVIVWADGKDYSPDDADGIQRTYTVADGEITLDEAVTTGVVGLPYDGDYETTKLAYAAALGTALTQKKRVDHIGFILFKTHINALRFGSDEDHLDPLPRMLDEGAQVDEDKIFDTFDTDSFPFPGEINTDARIWLKARAPRPCTILAAVPSIETSDKA